VFYCEFRTTKTKEAVANVTKVLVVDDEKTLADTLAIILNKAGFNASAVYSGTQAVEVAKSLKPDLIISDVAMPDMNGIEAMILIRGFLPTCKVLLFSGHASTVDLLETSRTRGHHFDLLAKPIHPRDLIARLTTA
jgi:CheY-like chemotaxis protein